MTSLVLNLPQDRVPAAPIVADLSVSSSCIYRPLPLWSPVDPLLVAAVVTDEGRSYVILDARDGGQRALRAPSAGSVWLTAWTVDRSLLTVAVPVYDDPAGWPIDHHIVTLDPVTGRELESVRASDFFGDPGIINPNALRWLNSEWLLFMEHRGTGVDTFLLLDLSEGTWQTVADLTLRYGARGRLLAFELWRAGGTRVGAVDLGPPSKSVWFDQGDVQKLCQVSTYGVIITCWDDRIGLPRLALWRPFISEGSAVSTVINREREKLRAGTGWGAVNAAGTMLACLEVQANTGGASQLSLLLFEGKNRTERIRLILGDIPDGLLGDQWLDSGWLSNRRPSWSPVGDRLAVVDCAGDLWLVDVVHASLSLLIPQLPVRKLSAEEVRLEWSQDGRFLAVVHDPGDGDTRLMVVTARL